MDEQDETAAFEAVYHSYFEQILRYCLRRLPVDKAADATAETFTIAWRRRQQIPRDRPLPWLYGVARRVVANEIRSQGRWERLKRRAMNTGVQLPSAETKVIEDDERVQVIASLGELRAADQEILMLACWEGLSRADLAAALGVSANAASKRLHRALDRLGVEMGVVRSSGHRFLRAEGSRS